MSSSIEKDFEQNLKYYLNKRCMTQAELAEKLETSRSSVSMWLTRGVMPKITTLNKICEILDIDLTELLNGPTLQKSLKPNEIVTTNGTQEYKLISDYRQLNGNGKMEAIKRVEELTEIPRYTKKETSLPPVNAAHADDYSNASDELKQQEEDIMNDENF